MIGVKYAVLKNISVDGYQNYGARTPRFIYNVIGDREFQFAKDPLAVFM